MLFTTENSTFDDQGCDKIDLNANVTLDQVHVHWTYNKGDNVIEMGYMNIEMLRNTLLEAMRRHHTETLTTKLFEKFWFYSMDEESEAPQPQEVFKMLFDKDDKGFLTKDEVEKLPIDALKELARIMDPPHGPKKEDQNAYDETKIPEPFLRKKEEKGHGEKKVFYENEEDNDIKNEFENETGKGKRNGREDEMNKMQNESPEDATIDAAHIEL